MNDRIRIDGMVFTGRHGVTAEERRRGQRFEVDVELGLDLEPAARTDDLSLTVDAREVRRTVQEAVEGPSLHLVEALAARIADALLGMEGVQEVRVRVRKPEAALFDGDERGYQVELRRRRFPEVAPPGRRRREHGA
jgi:dihydroneopterin aldolase